MSNRFYNSGLLIKSRHVTQATTLLAERGHLRLVPGANAPRHPATAPDLARPVLDLVSFQSGKDYVRLDGLTGVFTSLGSTERIEFVHHLSSQHGRPVAYKLDLRIAADDARRAEMSVRLRTALASAYPAYCFAAQDSCADENGDVDAPIAEAIQLTHRVIITPAGVLVCAKPAPAHLQTYSASTTRLPWLQTEAEAVSFSLPFPGDFPSWPLTEPLAELPGMPARVEIRMSIQGFALSEADQESIDLLIHRIEGGSLSVYHPHSPVTAYSTSADLQESVAGHLRQWLRHPHGGYAVACVVRSTEALCDTTTSRIAADVFGRHPTQIDRKHESGEYRHASSLFAHACRPSQGIPALMPGVGVLPALGIAQHYAPPMVTPPQTGAYLGVSVSGYRSTPVALPFESRSRHTMLVGASGTGKSSLLLQMITQDLHDPQRRAGVALLDAHGDLTERVFAMIPPERADDVIVVDVMDTTSTVCINPMEGMRDNPLHAQFVVGEIMSLVEMLFETTDSTGPMTRSNLRNLLLLAAWTPARHGTFLDAMRILEDGDFRDYLLSKCKDRSVVDYWEHFKKTDGSDHGFAAWVPYLMARLVPFTSNPIMKRLICRPDSSFDLAQAMNEKKIILLKLSKGVLQDIECRVLGALLLMKFFAAALSRARQPEHARVPFHLYIDEAQAFATDSFPRLLSEARKYNLCITTANQNIGQLRGTGASTNIAESLMANTATKFFFRLGPADLEAMRPYYKSQFDEGHMANLPDFHAVACLAKDNRPIPPFVLRVQAPTVSAADTEAVAQIVNGSRQKYGTPHDQANRQLAKLYDLSIETLSSKPEQALGEKTNPVYHEPEAPSEKAVAASSQASLNLFRHVNE